MLPVGADPMDLRYNVIHWTHRSTRGWSYGTSVVDPRTGEILKGNVNLGSLRLRQDGLIARGLVPPHASPTSACGFSAGPSFGYLAQATGGDSVEMALARVRQLAAHEVGHTLGFPHNYIASTYGGRASVMDYPAPLVKITNGEIDLSDAYAQGIGVYDELAVRWREEGDLEAGRRLVLSNLRLVVKIAMEYRRAWTNTLDLIQEGNLGLMQALQRFDPYRGVKLSSYGVYWIRAYILKYILDNIRMVRVGRSRAERKLFFRLNKEKRELEREGFRPEPKLLAERLDVTEDDVRDMEQRLSQSDLSLNAPVRRDDDSRSEYGDFIADGGQTAEENVGDAELRRVLIEKVHEFAANCPEREQKIIDQRLLAEEPRTLQQLGEEFGVSRERVRQIEARLMVRLSDFLKEELVDFDFYTTSGV